MKRFAPVLPVLALVTVGSVSAQPGCAPEGCYQVFAIPIESPNVGDRTIESSAPDPVASPFAWHDVDGVPGADFTDTRGNNVSAQEDHDANNQGGTRPDPGPGLEFLYPLDLTMDPPAYVDASTVNLFYWNNVLHDVLYLNGFDEVAGNFQVNNYGLGGAGGDAVQADTQDGAGTNGANFSTPPDGFEPRMQMFIWTLGTPHRDSSLDSGVIVHEYAHGPSQRLTGGPGNVSCLQNDEQMGEGWSDWYALVFTAQPSDTGPVGRGIGTYILFQPPNGPGIRTFPYSTDLAVNPQTYGDIGTLAIPHGVGAVWAAILWEVYWELVTAHGFNPDLYGDWTTGGNNLALRLVTDGLKFQPCSPTFVEGRDAILAAEAVLTGGENQCRLWRAFAKRGLGADADDGSSGTGDETEDFSVPPECTGLVFKDGFESGDTSAWSLTVPSP